MLAAPITFSEFTRRCGRPTRRRDAGYFVSLGPSRIVDA